MRQLSSTVVNQIKRIEQNQKKNEQGDITILKSGLDNSSKKILDRTVDELT